MGPIDKEQVWGECRECFSIFPQRVGQACSAVRRPVPLTGPRPGPGMALALGGHNQPYLVHTLGFLVCRGNLFQASASKLRRTMALGKMASNTQGQYLVEYCSPMA